MLHIITQSPYRSSALKECLAVAQTSDVLLFLGDGVYAVTLQNEELVKHNIYLLADHASARGLTNVAWANYIDYAGVVKLTEQQHPVQTWF